MKAEARLAEIEQTLAAITSGWPWLAVELNRRVQELTTQLVNADNEQTRGRIKALQDILELPVTLQQERDGISAGLAEDAPAN